VLDEEDGDAVVGSPRVKQGVAEVKCRGHHNPSKNDQAGADRHSCPHAAIALARPRPKQRYYLYQPQTFSDIQRGFSGFVLQTWVNTKLQQRFDIGQGCALGYLSHQDTASFFVLTVHIRFSAKHFEILMRSKTIHEATRNVISCPFCVISWIVLAQGKTTRNQFRALPGRPVRISFSFMTDTVN
jgi:hypothetical protein